METMERINDLTHIGSRSTVTCNTSGRSVVQAIAQCEQLSRVFGASENRRLCCGATWIA